MSTFSKSHLDHHRPSSFFIILVPSTSWLTCPTHLVPTLGVLYSPVSDSRDSNPACSRLFGPELVYPATRRPTELQQLKHSIQTLVFNFRHPSLAQETIQTLIKHRTEELAIPPRSYFLLSSRSHAKNDPARHDNSDALIRDFAR